MRLLSVRGHQSNRRCSTRPTLALCWHVLPWRELCWRCCTPPRQTSCATSGRSGGACIASRDHLERTCLYPTSPKMYVRAAFPNALVPHCCSTLKRRHGSDTLSVPNTMLSPIPMRQIRVEKTSDRDLVLFAEDVFLSIEGHGVSASDSARLLRGRQAPRGSISGTQQPHMRRFSMSRVAPSVRSAGSCMPPRYPQSPCHRCDCCLQWLAWHVLSDGRHYVRRNACWHGLLQSTRRQRAQR